MRRGADAQADRLLLSRVAVAQTPAVQISCQDLTNTIWRLESNHSRQVVDGSQEPSRDAGLELADARLCALYNARPLCDSLTRNQSRASRRTGCCFARRKRQRGLRPGLRPRFVRARSVCGVRWRARFPGGERSSPRHGLVRPPSHWLAGARLGRASDVRQDPRRRPPDLRRPESRTAGRDGDG
jgi:hypothetical protein